MFLKIGQRLDHGIEKPLGMLSDCHRRIEHFLSVLISITRQYAGHPLDPGPREQFEGALRYFSTAARQHTADEEESLFPRLDASRDFAARHTLAIVRRLEHDHAVANRLHATVDRLGRQWLQRGGLPGRDVEALDEALERLDSLYRHHIAVEDQQLFPAAARLLSNDDLRDIGQEMAQRRLVRAG